ncbi:MAG: zf-HC2 domain-containing protein, partial [Acidobacteriota bacterium]
MRCEEILGLIDDYHYGELGSRHAANVESHLERCAKCADVLKLLQSEDALYRRYAEETTGREDFSWQRVQARVGASGGGGARRRPWGGSVREWALGWAPRSAMARQALFATAVALISIAGTLAAVQYLGHMPLGSAEARLEAPADTTGAQDSLQSAMLSIQRAEQEYLQAIRALMDIVERQRPAVDPGLLAEFERKLRAADRSITATRAA